MQLKKIKNIDDVHFSDAWNLYVDAFPENERRTLKMQSRVMAHPDYNFEVFLEGTMVIGFMLWWNFNDFRYIDHFAVSRSIRNKGYGARILEQFIQSSTKPILLEVEYPNNSIDQRRIMFYERLGFKLNSHEYEVPSSTDDAKINLLVMTHPEAISKDLLEGFVHQNHPTIFDEV